MYSFNQENPRSRGRVPLRDEVERQVMLSKLRGIDGVCFFRFKFLYDRFNEFKDMLENLMG